MLPQRPFRRRRDSHPIVFHRFWPLWMSIEKKQGCNVWQSHQNYRGKCHKTSLWRRSPNNSECFARDYIHHPKHHCFFCFEVLGYVNVHPLDLVYTNEIKTLQICDFVHLHHRSLDIRGNCLERRNPCNSNSALAKSYWNLRFAENHWIVWSFVYLTSIQQKGEGTWELKEGTQPDLAVYLIEGQRAQQNMI